MAVLAVCCEPVSRSISLLTGKITGNTLSLGQVKEPRVANQAVNPVTCIKIT
jgi:hypothetical protein